MACGYHFIGQAGCLACNQSDEAAKTRRTIEDEANRSRKHAERQAYRASDSVSTGVGDGLSGLVLFLGIIAAIVVAALGMAIAMFVVPGVIIAEAVLWSVAKWKPDNMPAGWQRGNRNRVVLDRFATWCIPMAVGLVTFAWFGQSLIGVLGGLAAGFIFIMSAWRMIRFVKRMSAVA